MGVGPPLHCCRARVSQGGEEGEMKLFISASLPPYTYVRVLSNALSCSKFSLLEVHLGDWLSLQIVT